jgi:hypothetical protein
LNKELIMEQSSRIVRLNGVRLAFPHLHAPRVKTDPETGKQLEPRYEATLLFPPGSDNHKLVSAAIQTACKEKWPIAWAEELKRIKAKDKLCVRDGDLKSKFDGFAGNKDLSVARKSKNGAPELVGANGKPLDPTKVGETLYAGCYVVAELEFYAYKAGSNYPAGVSCQLLGMQFVKHGDAFARTTVSSGSWEDLSSGSDDGGFSQDEEDSLV